MEKAYARQLAAEYEDLQAHAGAAAAALKLPAIGVPYEIRPLFVTRRLVPATFVSTHVLFITLTDLARNLFVTGQDGNRGYP